MRELLTLLFLSLIAVNGLASTDDTLKSVYQRGDEVFTVVEKMPEFPGGADSLVKFLSMNLRYPQLAIDQKIEGRVYVEFIVNPDGTLSHVNLKEGYDIGGGCGAEAIRVVSSMPRWSPGMQRGMAVPVSMILPVKFSLIENPYLALEDTFNREDPAIDSLILKLNWMVEEGEDVTYRTLISDVGHTLKYNELGSLINEGDAKLIDREEVLEAYDHLQQARELIRYVSTVTVNNEDIHVQLQAISEGKPTVVEIDGESTQSTLANQLVEGVLLKGTVSDDGSITSMNEAQEDRNLLSLLFQLPSGQIAINDEWSINIQLLQMKESFKILRFDSINQVSLSDIRVDDGDTIAVIKYQVYDYVVGYPAEDDEEYSAYFAEESDTSIGSRLSQESDGKLYLLMLYQGLGEFSVSQGKWVSYNGLLLTATEGAYEYVKAVNYSLIPE